MNARPIRMTAMRTRTASTPLARSVAPARMVTTATVATALVSTGEKNIRYSVQQNYESTRLKLIRITAHCCEGGLAWTILINSNVHELAGTLNLFEAVISCACPDFEV